MPEVMSNASQLRSHSDLLCGEDVFPLKIAYPPDMLTMTIQRTPSPNVSAGPPIFRSTGAPAPAPSYVTAKESSTEWLKKHGLFANHLTVDQILPTIGFRLSQDYDRSLKKPVISRYGEGLFHRVFHGRDGKTYNVSCEPCKLQDLSEKLQKQTHLLESRLDFLTTGSVSQFGLLLASRVTVLVHCRLDVETASSTQSRSRPQSSQSQHQSRPPSRPQSNTHSRDPSQIQARAALEFPSNLHEPSSLAGAAALNTTTPHSTSSSPLLNALPSNFPRLGEALHALVDDQLIHLDAFQLLSTSKRDNLHLALTEATGEEKSSRLTRAREWIDSLIYEADDDNNETSLKDTLDTLENTENGFVKDEVSSLPSSALLYVTNEINDDEEKLLKEFFRLNSSKKSFFDLRVVSFNASRAAAGRLRSLAKELGADFHVHTDARLALSHGVLCEEERAGDANEEVYLIWEEVEEAKSILAEVTRLASSADSPRVDEARLNFDVSPRKTAAAAKKKKEDHTDADSGVGSIVKDNSSNRPLSSDEWLARIGSFKVQGLTYEQLVNRLAFKHSDGVLKRKCIHQGGGSKVVNATYCSAGAFAHVPWRNGSVAHVNVTAEEYRKYQRRVNAALRRIEKRIAWLRQGTREVFGTILESNIYILIDTSSSMVNYIDFVKERLEILVREQLEARKYMNMNFVQFGASCSSWKSKLQLIEKSSSELLEDLVDWIRGLRCQGSTNTLAALDYALGDEGTEAVYLLTDGRPDQPPDSILSDVIARPNLPLIHTISFNCVDEDSNLFLQELASRSGGRFHVYSSADFDRGENDPFAALQSVDIMLLKNEICFGQKCLSLAAYLRDECLRLRDDARERRINEEEVKRKEKEKEERRKLRALSAPDLPITTVSIQSGNGKKKKIRKKKEPAESIDAGDEALSLALHEELSSKAQNPESSKQWLRRHGLNAKHLTLMEVLAPSMVPQVPKWIPILDKAVVSKVFTDVGMMPLSKEGRPSSGKGGGGGGGGGSGESSENVGEGAKKMGRVPPRVCNPHAVKLDTYEKKLEKLASKITDRIISVSRSALGKAGEEAEGELASILPSSSKEKEKSCLIDLLSKFKLEEISDEVTLLENELSRAKKYQRRSEEIRQMSTDLVKDARKSKKTKYEISSDSKSAGKKKKKGKKFEREDDASLFTATVESDLLSPSDPPRPNVGNLRGQRPRSADLPRGVTFKDPPVEGPSVGAKDSPVSPSCSAAGSSSRPASASRPATSQPRHASSAPPVRVSTTATRRAFGTLDDPTRPKLHPHSLKGQRVIARDANSGFYYPGVVLSCPKPGEAHVQFDSTAMSVDNQLVQVKYVIPTSGAIGRPSLRAGDAALTRVLLGETKDEIWIPCHVTHLPHSGDDQTLLFHSVEIYSGKMLTSPRRHLIKVAENSFVQTVQFIHDVQRREEFMRHVEEQKRLAGFREKLRVMDATGGADDRGDSFGEDAERERVVIPWGAKEAKLYDSEEEDDVDDTDNYHDDDFDDESDGGENENGDERNSDGGDDSDGERSGSEGGGTDGKEDPDMDNEIDILSKNNARDSPDSSEDESKEEGEADLLKESSAGDGQSERPKILDDRKDETSRSVDAMIDVGKEEEEKKMEEEEVNVTGKGKNDSSDAEKDQNERENTKSSERGEKKSKRKSSKSPKSSKSDTVVKSSEVDKAKDEVVQSILKELPFDTQKILLEEHQRRLQDLNERLRRQVVDGEMEKQKSRQKQKRMLKRIKKELEAKGEEVKEIMRKEREIEEAERRAEMDRRRDEDILDLRNRYKSAMMKAWCEDQQREGAEKASSSSSSSSTESRSHVNTASSASQQRQRDSKLKLLRSSLSTLEVGAPVLARWDDDGWYYRGKILTVGPEDGAYLVADATEGVATIWRENLMTEADDAEEQLAAESPVVAMHPNFAGSYAPGVVLAVHPNMAILIRFFDATQTTLPRHEVFRSTAEKFQADVDHILDCELRLLNQVVVARDDATGFFNLAVVSDRLGPPSHHFVLEWPDGSKAVQPRSLIFGSHTPRRDLRVGDRVLSPGISSSAPTSVASSRASDLDFLPSWVVGPAEGENAEGRFVVKRCDGSVLSEADPLQCFWITRDFFDEAIQYIEMQSH